MNNDKAGFGMQDAGFGIRDSGFRSSERVECASHPLHPASCIPNPRSSKGFTLIELIVAITIIAFLAGVLINRIWFYSEQAEKAAMEQVAGALQSALVMQYGHLLTHGNEAEAKNLVSENPTRWLMRKPPNYAGEFYGMTPAAIPPGNWAFDLKTRELIYVPERSDNFVPGRDGRKWVRYRARLEYEPMPVVAASGVADPGVTGKGAGELSGLLFEPVERYQWFIRGEK